MLFQASANKFSYVPTIILYTLYKGISIDVSKKVYVILCNLWICSKNVASSCSHYLQNRSVLPFVLFVLITKFSIW